MFKEYSFFPSIMAYSMQYEIEHTMICTYGDPIKKKNQCLCYVKVHQSVCLHPLKR